jgi:hypothetical protein
MTRHLGLLALPQKGCCIIITLMKDEKNERGGWGTYIGLAGGWVIGLWIQLGIWEVGLVSRRAFRQQRGCLFLFFTHCLRSAPYFYLLGTLKPILKPTQVAFCIFFLSSIFWFLFCCVRETKHIIGVGYCGKLLLFVRYTSAYEGSLRW